MNKTHRLLFSFLAVIMLCSFGHVRVNAATKVTSVKNGYYYIQSANGSNRYLDIVDEKTDNGAELQIWDKASQHQNQVFQIVSRGDSWVISAHHSKKVIEVRDSGINDGDTVAQWDYVGINCQRWYIIDNGDGSVSFQNKNSGKYLDVFNNATENGSRVKQWSRNDTTAQKFYLWKCSDSDLLNATWNVDLTQKMEWTNYSLDDDYINDTNYHSESNFTACPTPGKTYLLRKEYLDNDHVFETIRSKSLAKSSMSKFTDLAISNSSDFVASRLLTKIGFENIPGLSSAMSIIEILSTANSDADWNAFATTAQNGKGIIKYTYIKIEDKPIWGVIPGSAAYGWIHHIDDVKTYKYEVWDGEGEFTTVPGYTGTWTFRFK